MLFLRLGRGEIHNLLSFWLIVTKWPLVSSLEPWFFSPPPSPSPTKTSSSASGSFHLSEVPGFLCRAFSASWPQWVPSAPLACTGYDSFPLIWAMSCEQGPGETLLPAKDQSAPSCGMWGCPGGQFQASSPEVPPSASHLRFCFWVSGVKADLPALSHVCLPKTHTGVGTFPICLSQN